MIDVSVIIPTFNRSQMLSRALSSVARQRQLPSEVIVVDDGSTDDTRRKVAMIADSSPARVSVLETELVERGTTATPKILET